MKYIFYVSILVFTLSFPALAQKSFQAIVNENEATFTFPLNPEQEYEWSSGGLTYQWSVIVTNNKKRYELGFFLYTPQGASSDESGNINALLEAGQFSVWSGNKVLDSIKVSGFANEAKDKLTIKISDKKSIQLLFSSKPKYVTFSTLLELFEKPTNVRVPVEYSIQEKASQKSSQVSRNILATKSWQAFWTNFSNAVYTRNLKTLVQLSCSNFFYYDGTAEDWLKSNIKTSKWNLVKKAVLSGTRPLETDERNEIERITIKYEDLIFKFENGKRWCFSQPAMGD